MALRIEGVEGPRLLLGLFTMRNQFYPLGAKPSEVSLFKICWRNVVSKRSLKHTIRNNKASASISMASPISPASLLSSARLMERGVPNTCVSQLPVGILTKELRILCRRHMYDY